MNYIFQEILVNQHQWLINYKKQNEQNLKEKDPKEYIFVAFKQDQLVCAKRKSFCFSLGKKFFWVPRKFIWPDFKKERLVVSFLNHFSYTLAIDFKKYSNKSIQGKKLIEFFKDSIISSKEGWSLKELKSKETEIEENAENSELSKMNNGNPYMCLALIELEQELHKKLNEWKQMDKVQLKNSIELIVKKKYELDKEYKAFEKSNPAEFETEEEFDYFIETKYDYQERLNVLREIIILFQKEYPKVKFKKRFKESK